MDRFLHSFVMLCILVIAGAVGAVALFALKMTPTESLFLGLVALTGLALLSSAQRRARERADLDAKFAAQAVRLAEAKAEMEALATMLAARVAAEPSPARDERAPEDVGELRTALAEMSGLVNRLMRTATDHAGAIEKLKTAGRPAPEMPARPALAEKRPPAEAAPPAARIEPKPPVIPAREPRSPLPGLAAPVPRAATPQAARLPSRAEEAEVRRALEADRVELFLQPIVTLPQRRVRFYEALTRLRDAGGAPIEPSVFLPVLEASGALAALDAATVYRAVQILRRPATRGRGVGIFCNLSNALLNDAAEMAALLEFLRGEEELADALIFECAQAQFQAGGAAADALASLAGLGFRLSLDRVTEIDVDARALNQRGVAFLKVTAERLLAPQGRDGVLRRRPQDLVARLSGFGIGVVADHVETEAEVLDLLELDIGLGQGFLFARPRPVRADVLQDEEPPAKAAPQAAVPAAPEPSLAEIIASRLPPPRELAALRDGDRGRTDPAPLPAAAAPPAEPAAKGRLTGLRALVRRI